MLIRIVIILIRRNLQIKASTFIKKNARLISTIWKIHNTKSKNRQTRFLKQIYLHGLLTLCYRKNFLKYTIDEYDHFLRFFDRWIRIWHLFFSTTSRFCCTWSRNFCISIENWKKNFEQDWTITMFSMLFNVFLDKESEKNIRINLSCLYFLYRFVGTTFGTQIWI